MPTKKKTTSKSKPSQKVGTKINASSDLASMTSRLGLKIGESEIKIKYVLQGLMDRSPRTWTQLGLTEKDFKAYGVEFVQK